MIELASAVQTELRSLAPEVEAADRKFWKKIKDETPGVKVDIKSVGLGHRVMIDFQIEMTQFFDQSGLLKDEMVLPRHPGIGIESPRYTPTITVEHVDDFRLVFFAADCRDGRHWLHTHATNKLIS